MEAQTTNDTLYYIWFAALIFLLVVFFIAKLKFNKIFERREARRRMLSYSKVKLSPNEEGRSRILKIKRIT